MTLVLSSFRRIVYFGSRILQTAMFLGLYVMTSGGRSAQCSHYPGW